LVRSPQWVWVALDPATKLLLAIEVGARTLAMAQCLVHQVAQVLAPDCVPLFLTDGFKAYLTAVLTHYGRWVQRPVVYLHLADKSPACETGSLSSISRGEGNGYGRQPPFP
jgi:hypothetical protein